MNGLSITILPLFAFVIVQSRQLWTDALCPLAVYKYGDEVEADAMLRDLVWGMYTPPSANQVPTRGTFTLPSPSPTRSPVPIQYYCLRTSIFHRVIFNIS